MPYKSSNIPSKMFYSAMSAEILRICKATTNFRDFTNSTKLLIERIEKQGGLIKPKKNALLKLFNQHKKCFRKFKKADHFILNKLF
mgnify:FL=1